MLFFLSYRCAGQRLHRADPLCHQVQARTTRLAQGPDTRVQHAHCTDQACRWSIQLSILTFEICSDLLVQSLTNIFVNPAVRHFFFSCFTLFQNNLVFIEMFQLVFFLRILMTFAFALACALTSLNSTCPYTQQRQDILEAGKPDLLCDIIEMPLKTLFKSKKQKLYIFLYNFRVDFCLFV